MTTAMRFFNTAGPIKAEIHYHVQLLARLDVEVGQSACLGVDPRPTVAGQRAWPTKPASATRPGRDRSQAKVSRCNLGAFCWSK